MQPRFERRAPHSATTLLAQPRFRAGLDFLRLRGKVGEADPALAEWWETFFQAGDDERYRMLEAVREPRGGPRRVRRVTAAEVAGQAEEGAPAASGASRSTSRRGAAGGASKDDAAPGSGDAAGDDDAAGGDDAASAESPAPRKRRRRRRRPGEPAANPTP